MNDELCEFNKSCLTRNMEANRKMARCGTFDEAVQTQTDFARTLMNECIAEGAKLAEMGTQVIFDGLSAWKALAPRKEEETTKHSMAAE